MVIVNRIANRVRGSCRHARSLPGYLSAKAHPAAGVPVLQSNTAMLSPFGCHALDRCHQPRPVTGIQDRSPLSSTTALLPVIAPRVICMEA